MASFNTSASSSVVEFQEGDMDKYLQQLQSYTFIQEMERDVDISDKNNSTRDILSRANETKSQDVDKVCLSENMAHNRDVRYWPNSSYHNIWDSPKETNMYWYMNIQAYG
ncbi:hypothetical protein Goshw_025718 [Gossypium schwendimanii]|uniref:Uncharacterized protein n=1 Tax=Gossypium schwendimanii TaxID=34291 RepID=A0A7J9LCG7_GOSSC|nr:hypothetical protein [Gossypium schwendimanii]